jgi:hypothetical protein
MHATHKQPSSVESALTIARKMPARRHFVPGRKFNIADSEAVDWLISQDAIRQLVWNLCKPGLTLDIESGCWRGIENQSESSDSVRERVSRVAD